VTGSHSPSLLTVVERTLREECQIDSGDHLLLAVSGGPDSMALLHVLATLRARVGFVLSACGLDHGLRSEAATELAIAAALAARLEVGFQRYRLAVDAGGNLHARAREARYAALERERGRVRADYLVTAHHAEDRAETLLIRLLSGSGPRGLAVLPPRSVDNRLRPMVRARRAQILAHLERHQIESADDPSNRDERFLRTRVRHEVLPMLESISPGIVGHLTGLADEIAEPALPDVLDEAGDPVALNRSHRNQLRRALRHRQAATRVLLGAGREIVLDSQTGQPRLRRSLRGASSVGDSVSKLRPPGLKKSKSG
jgi:tRNA(Ile)-lysidine synthase